MAKTRFWLPWLLFLPQLLLQVTTMVVSSAAPTSFLRRGDCITGKQTLRSVNGMYEVGIFRLGRGWYAGIWIYEPLSAQPPVVWVANRDNPVPRTQTQSCLRLCVSLNGTLAFLNSGVAIWSAGAGKPALGAVIRDNGNLALLDRHPGTVTWESFGEPGDTWMPGMRINAGQRLTSWWGADDPGQGPYTLEMDPAGANQFVLMWRRAVVYWESGLWNGQIFAGLPEMATKYVYDFSFVHNKTAEYFTYDVNTAALEAGLVTRFVLHRSGEVRLYTKAGAGPWSIIWSKPSDRCQIYGVCGAFGVCGDGDGDVDGPTAGACTCPDSDHFQAASASDSGCVRVKPLAPCPASNASAALPDRFVELNSIFPSDNEKSTLSTPSPSLDSCMKTCLRSCKCTALAYTSGRCQLWQGPLLSLQRRIPSPPTALFVRTSASHKSSNPKRQAATVYAKLVIASIALAATTTLATVLFIWYRHTQSQNHHQGHVAEDDVADSALRLYTYKELQAATRNFAERLGGGGFGSVYKGLLPDKTAIAVKKLEGSTQGEKQFRMEVGTIGTIQHVNLVRLRGFCSDGRARLLVYDFMPHGSLNQRLFGHDGAVLDWRARMAVAVGTARAIQYLHDKCRERIIHCDIKPENILLDRDMRPKVADFGLAKLVGRDLSEVLTTMRGTRGYLAPEWLSGAPITPKADVYSFGMTLLEIMSGRRNLAGGGGAGAGGGAVFYPTWVLQRVHAHAKGVEKLEILELVDERVRWQASEEEVTRVAVAAGWCIQDDAHARPCMAHVVNVLEGIVPSPPLPPVPASLLLLVEHSAATPPPR